MSKGKVLKVRSLPRISATTLGDYMAELDAAAHEGMLREHKYKKEGGPSAWYGRANTAIRAALATTGDTLDHLAKSAEQLRTAPATTDRQIRDRRLCVRSINEFAKFFEGFDRKNLTFALSRIEGYKIAIEGVEVSVRPLARIARTKRDGSIVTGALLAVQRQKPTVAARAGGVAAELVRMSLIAAGDKNVDPDICLVVDVQRNRIFAAPRSGKKLRSAIEATCRAIALIWPAIKPKPTTDEAPLGTVIVGDVPPAADAFRETPRSAS